MWRGYNERHRLSGRRDLVQQTRAAIKIQRCIRTWLERLEGKKGEMPVHLRPPGLTDDRRVELQKTISNYREENPVSKHLFNFKITSLQCSRFLEERRSGGEKQFWSITEEPLPLKTFNLVCSMVISLK